MVLEHARKKQNRDNRNGDELMPTLFVMIGLPASGKSTKAKQIIESEGGTVLSSDGIRFTLYGDENIQGDPKEIFQYLHESITSNLQNGTNVVFDATNISYKNRMQLLQRLNKIDGLKKIAVLVATPWHEILENNKSRERFVPEMVVERMRKNFFAPFWGEGWDDIQIIWNTRMSEQDIINRYNLKDLFYALDDFDQDNPHHEHTLGEHIRLVRDDAYLLSNDILIRTAATFHDIGKLWTKQFKNSKGEPTDIAHYYNHEQIGAYMSLYHLKAEGWNDKDVIDIATMIQFHMRPYGAKTEKAKMKLKKLVGTEVYEKLLLLNQADIGAH